YLILGIVWAGYSMAEEYDDWWLDVGFYGGLVGGFGAAFFFMMARNQARDQGYPDGEQTPNMPYPVSPPPQPPTQ
ncbi:MAG: hypothetical protein GWN97_21255, partial [Thermoplasmata archaeon]|nr:hypothetical protein [Thermoplasmata archaeon]